MDPEGVPITPTDAAYFMKIEADIGRKLTHRQRAWWVATRDNDFGGEAPLMWQEYPSTPDEAFQQSTEGCYYAAQLAAARESGRVLLRIPVEAAPVNTFWDLGRGDMTAIWFHQRIGVENRFIGYYEASGEDLSHYAKHLQGLGYTYGRHYLPHDAGHKRLGETPDTNRSMQEMLEALMPGQRVDLVPRITKITAGIQATRNVFASCLFSEEACSTGLARLANYRKRWDKVRGCWSDDPVHDDASHGADAFRQFGQVADGGAAFAGQPYAQPGPGRAANRFGRRGRSSAAV
jgi:hypothetical protein